MDTKSGYLGTMIALATVAFGLIAAGAWNCSEARRKTGRAGSQVAVRQKAARIAPVAELERYPVAECLAAAVGGDLFECFDKRSAVGEDDALRRDVFEIGDDFDVR